MGAYDESESFGGFPEYRPAVVLDDVRGASVKNLDAQLEPGIEKVVTFRSERVSVE
jgi:hypothetical protein